LPGYGYAKISREISGQWPSFIDPYLRERPVLALCIVLIDSNIAPQESDQQLIDFLAATDRPFVIVATKSDRLSGNQLQTALRTLGQRHPQARVVPFSAKTGAGKEQVWQEIRKASEEMQSSRLRTASQS
jgi:GTP-binding protein